MESRYWNHVCHLRNHQHSIEDMQRDYDDFGEDYSLYLLDEIKVSSERRKEYEWMNKLKSYIRGIGYNYKNKAVIPREKLPLKSGIPTFYRQEEKHEGAKQD